MTKRELKEFLIWYRSEPDIVRKSLDVTNVVDMYEKFVNSHASEESRIVSENKDKRNKCDKVNCIHPIRNPLYYKCKICHLKH